MLELLTCEGHIVGMLDRDQRTAKLSYFNRHVLSSTKAHKNILLQTSKHKQTDITTASINIQQHQTDDYDNFHNINKRKATLHTHYKYGHYHNILLRLKHALIVGVYLSFATFPSSIHTAPTIRKSPARMDDHPKWINPCGIRTDFTAMQQHDAEIRQISDSELLTQIVDQANIAYSKAKQFKEDFVQKTFNMNSDQLHNLWKDSHYEWLPTADEIPKSLGQVTPKDHLDKLELETALLNTYEHLQKIAVGLEQIVWDQHDEHGAFESSFKEAEHNLRNLLCELQMTIYEHNIKMRPDITRTIMTEEFRKMDNTSTNLRNWLIYRDYMNILEYVIEAFNNLKEKL